MAAESLLYLDAAAVGAAMPPLSERLALARRTLSALVADAELPPKMAVHPRAPQAFAHAMPALLRGAAADGADDLLGIKWVTGYPDNGAQRLPAIHALVLLNDALTGQPRAILDGGPITAARTAAVSGVVLTEWWPAPADAGRPSIVALVGAGVQGHSHVAMLGEVAPGAELRICDRHADRAAALAEVARASRAFGDVSWTTDDPAALDGADVVLTMVSFGPDRQALPASALAGARLIVGVDYDMCVPAAVARNARQFLVDDVAQFVATRATGPFAGYRDPDGSIGEALVGRALDTRASGPIFVNHLGVGLADVIFGDAIVSRARRMGLGVELQR